MDIRIIPDTSRRKYLLAFLLLLLIAVVSVSFSMENGEDYDAARREILIRKIGDELLRKSGDNQSRVLPVKKMSENEYQLSFEKEFSFQPGALVNITRRVLGNDPNTRDYTVNVLNCGNSTVVYGYAISSNRKNDIIACIGRQQPMACYLVNIKFQRQETNTAQHAYLLGGLVLFALIGFTFVRPGKPRSILPQQQTADIVREGKPANRFALGSVLFDAQNKKLIQNETTTDLTDKENRVLFILASSPNVIIERSRLQKEIWEDEGVIVGRSLDMFVSKLRKKLEVDTAVKIVVIRGKGYKLEINS